MMRNLNTAVGGGLLLLVLLGGCGEVFVSSSGAGGDSGAGAAPAGGSGGGNQGGGPGGSAGEGGGQDCLPPPRDACQTCLFESCNLEYCSCAAESSCVGLFTCLAMPNAVGEICWQKNVDGISLAGSLQACGSQKCAQCGFDPVAECQACQYTNCAAEVNACYSDADCYGFVKCFATCKANGGTSSTCSAMCNSAFPDGVPLAQDLAECTQGGGCAETCVQ